MAYKANTTPMFKDLANQAYEAHLIRQPKLTSLAKFSISFFAEMWLQQQAAKERYEKQQLGTQRAPVKDVGGNLYTGSKPINGG
jgi:thiaminase